MVRRWIHFEHIIVEIDNVCVYHIYSIVVADLCI